ncbi:glycerol-3-phosphate dehydrogenase [Erysipelotrichaceae bacterium]|nr:glycerol-3-phosphate dehydrogenase [Erysipelotrichaceae bacterium]
MKVTVIGAGAWGGALAQVLCDNGHDVVVWTHDVEHARQINEQRQIVALTKKEIEHTLSERIVATSDLAIAVEHGCYLLFVVPSFALRSVAIEVAKHMTKPKICISATKGIEKNTHLLMTEVIEDVLTENLCIAAVALSGPSHAEEVIQRKITAIVAAHEKNEYAVLVQGLFNNDTYFRVYANTDRKGVELGGALKNIIAIISGMLSAYDLGDNAKAALITRGLFEMTKIGVASGAREQTFSGLAGLGDLIATTTSVHSRNFQAGILLAKGLSAEEVEISTQATVEGFYAVKAAIEIVNEKQVYAPLIVLLYELLENKITPAIMLERLFQREMKDEFTLM